MSASVAETKPAKDARNAGFGPFSAGPATVADIGLHYADLSSEPKLKAIQTFFLDLILVGVKVW